MSFFLDPREPVRKQVDDVTFLVRVLDSAERARLLSHLLPLQRSWEDGEDELSVSLSPENVERLGAIVRLGIVGWEGKGVPTPRRDKRGYLTQKSLGLVPFEKWGSLLTEILAVNIVTEDDEGN